jgi:hypothetical protein
MFPKNKKIGIDLDETIASVFEAVLEYTKTLHPRLSHVCFEDLTHHDWWKIDMFEFSRDEALECWRTFDKENILDKKISPVFLSQEGVHLLISQGYSLYGITGRSESSRREATEIWIDCHFPDIFTSITYTNHTELDKRIEKSEVCKRL